MFSSSSLLFLLFAFCFLLFADFADFPLFLFSFLPFFLFSFSPSFFSPFLLFSFSFSLYFVLFFSRFLSFLFFWLLVSGFLAFWFSCSRFSLVFSPSAFCFFVLFAFCDLSTRLVFGCCCSIAGVGRVHRFDNAPGKIPSPVTQSNCLTRSHHALLMAVSG